MKNNIIVQKICIIMDVDFVNINELTNAEVALRMRKLNYEKFKTLVRMHLSFELDLNTDEFDLPCHEILYEDKGKLKKWNRLSKKHKHSAGVATTGCASTSKASTSTENSPVENLHQQINAGFLLHLEELKDFLLLKKNLTQEGLFRKTGSASRQNELRQQIQHDKPLNLESSGYSAHDCATVFKGYLAELPEPLLTDAHYPAHLQIAPLCIGATFNTAVLTSASTVVNASKQPNPDRLKREQHLLNSIQLLLLLLPDENRQLLQHIIEILHAVAANEALNKMSPENLATLFAPHLICPRNLPPEALHYVSKKMSSIIAYMICKGVEIFDMPAKLSTDIRAYFHERKRKKTMSPEQTLDESISDISTVNTVYTFVDREKTAAAHTTNTTDTELAQLYAHIQSLPESSKKRRLIKQFNKQNGQGTPLQLVVMNRLKNSDATRSAKSISDSIKKHIFHKGIMMRTPKRSAATATPASENFGTPNYSITKNPKLRVLFQSPAQGTSTVTSSSSSLTSSGGSSSTICTAVNTPYVAKTHHLHHPLKKSISSSSLLLNSSSCLSHTAQNAELHIDENESSLSSSSSTAVVESKCCVSAPVSRQISNEVYPHLLTSTTLNNFPCHSLGLNTSFQSASTVSQHFQLPDANCCVNPLKLLTEAAKQLLSSSSSDDRGKTVAWDEKQLLEIEEESNTSVQQQQQQNTKELKSRYKSEPNLSRVLSKEKLTDVAVTPAHENADHRKAQSGSRSLTRKLMKGVSMGNLKFPFSTPESTKRLVHSVSSTLRRRSHDDHLHLGAHNDKATTEPEDQARQVVNEEPFSVDLEDLDDETFEDNPADHLCSDSDVADDDDDDSVDGVTSDNIILEDGKSADAAVVVGAHSNSSSSSISNSYNELPSCSRLTACQQILLQQSGVCKHLDLITSTPSLLLRRRSMSPITKSTQRMPKAMQESIMTPRSRKPVMVLTTTLSSSDQNQTMCQTDLSSFREQDEDQSDNVPGADDIQDKSDFGQEKLLLLPQVHDEDATSVDSYLNILSRRQQTKPDCCAFAQQHQIDCMNAEDTKDHDTERNALSKNFKKYLLKRCVLTASPVDSSFSSQPDDYDSTQEIEDLDDSDELSPSLLYCLDGNQPDNAQMPKTNEQCNEKDNTAATASATLEVQKENPITENISSDGRLYRSRIANNPFILLNNARKRAATSDLEKITKSPLGEANAASTNMQTQSTQTTNKENLKDVEGYLRSRKMLISEYPGETSF